MRWPCIHSCLRRHKHDVALPAYDRRPSSYVQSCIWAFSFSSVGYSILSISNGRELGSECSINDIIERTRMGVVMI